MLLESEERQFQADAADLRETLCRVARTANRLAKVSFGRNRAEAYKIKVAALNSLIERGWAIANGIDRDGVVGLDIASDNPLRLHIPSVFLSVQARAKVYAQASVSQPDDLYDDFFGFNDGE
jgi:hypothetical protein